MTWRLIEFDGVSLVGANQVDEISSGAAATAYQRLPWGGALDGYGNAVTRPGAIERIKSVRLVEDDQAALEATYYHLVARRGHRAPLFRQTASGEVHWMWARLVDVQAQYSYEQAQYRRILDVQARFVLQEAYWRGVHTGNWLLDNGRLLDNGLTFDSDYIFDLTRNPTLLSVPLPSGVGREPSRNVRITLTAGSADIIQAVIERIGGERLEYGGTIVAGTSLVIDAGAMQVTNNGADAYADLTFRVDADLTTWFSLRPGRNTVSVSISGGGTDSTIAFAFDEAWV